MLAGTDPQTPLDTRRLSEFLPEPENSHGARNAHRTPPRHRGGLKAKFNANHRDPPRPGRAALGALPGYVRRASDRRTGFTGLWRRAVARRSVAQARVEGRIWGVVPASVFFFASRNNTLEPAAPPRLTLKRGEQRDAATSRVNRVASGIAQRAAGSG
jgi:hypothetical protein